MIVRHASDFDYAYVCKKLRAENREECAAIRGHDDPARLAREFNAFADIAAFRAAFCEDAAPRGEGRAPASGEPIALLAAFRAGGGLAAMHLIATPAWPQISRAAYRFMRKVVVPRWFAFHKITCAQTDVLDRGAADRAWLGRLGFADDGPPAALGRNGEIFQRVTWRVVDAAGPGLASAMPQQGHATHV
jgi:hypothetical protein